MESTALWAKLCLTVSTLLNANLSEDTFQQLFEAQLKAVFGWDDGDVQRKVPVHMGRQIKQADLLLSTPSGKVVVEMRKPGLTLGEKEIGQLISYMRILGVKFGLLVGDKIKVFYDDDSTGKPPAEVADIPFLVTSVPGTELGAALERNAFSDARMKEFCVKQIKRAESAREMEEIKNRLLFDDGAWMKEIVRQYLIDGGYKDIARIDSMLSGINLQSANGIDDFSKSASLPIVTRPDDRHEPEAPKFMLIDNARGVAAEGTVIDGKFTVLKGSIVTASMGEKKADFAETIARAWESRNVVHGKLLAQARLIGDGTACLESNFAFSSPSEAACVIKGVPAWNGRTAWVDHNGVTYGEWEDGVLSGANESDEGITRSELVAKVTQLHNSNPSILANLVGLNTGGTHLKDRRFGKVKIYTFSKVSGGRERSREITPKIHIWVDLTNVDAAKALKQYQQIFKQGGL